MNPAHARSIEQAQAFLELINTSGLPDGQDPLQSASSLLQLLAQTATEQAAEIERLRALKTSKLARNGESSTGADASAEEVYAAVLKAKTELVRCFVHGEPPAKADAELRGVLENFLSSREHSARRATSAHEEAEPDSAAGLLNEDIERTLREAEEARVRLHDELTRAHDWRYSLESHSREAAAAISEYLQTNRAPSKEALSDIFRTLRAGIEWSS